MEESTDYSDRNGRIVRYLRSLYTGSAASPFGFSFRGGAILRHDKAAEHDRIYIAARIDEIVRDVFGGSSHESFQIKNGRVEL
jgi:hypothetical protein